MQNTYNEITQLSFIEHALQCRTMYLGDVTVDTKKEFYIIPDGSDPGIKYGENTYSAGLAKIFDEALTNATDNYQRYPNIKDGIEIDITPEYFRIKNYGPNFKIEKNANGYYYPEVAFSQDKTSSNYNASSDSTTNGQNGLGIKLANVFSKKFIINIVSNNTNYVQTFENNLSIINPPQISKTSQPNSVEVICYPDFKELGLTNSSMSLGDYYHLYYRAFSSVLFGREVKINNTIHKPMNFIDYSNLLASAYIPQNILKNASHYVYNTQSASALIYVVPTKYHNRFSFVNNISTVDNGTHVDNLTKQIRDSFKFEVKNSPTNYILMFLNQVVTLPKFEGQAKNKLTSKNFKIDFGYLTSQLSVDPSLLTYVKGSTSKASKTTANVFYEKCSPALMVNSEPEKCTLYITEGDSASGMARQGFHEIGGFKYNGIFSLRGKVLNVSKATEATVRANDIIRNLVKELGLSLNNPTDYSNLRYGRIVMLKDADVDGNCIMGLVYNIFYKYFKELLSVKGFFNEFTTPAYQIVLKQKINPNAKGIEYSNNVKHEFTNKTLFDAKIAEIPESQIQKINYLKGLGSLRAYDISRYFKNINDCLIPVIIDDQPGLADAWMEQSYGKGVVNINKRKQHVMEYDQNLVLERKPGKPITISEFQYVDMNEYNVDACYRSMVNIYDGLKPSYRKILYACFKLGKKAYADQKVYVLAGSVATIGKYMHGNASLEETIFTMMRNWAGGNNIPLLTSECNIGTRLDLGEAHAQSRYVETRLSDIARLIYVKDDDVILSHVQEEGEEAEPVHYVPIIPMTLINGAAGIGTGYSNNIPNHNQYDCINYIRTTLNDSRNINGLKVFPNEKCCINPYYPDALQDLDYTYDKNGNLTGYISYGRHAFIMPLHGDTSRQKGIDPFWKCKLLEGRSGQNPQDYNPCYYQVTGIPIGVNCKQVIEDITKYLGLTEESGKASSPKKKVKKVDEISEDVEGEDADVKANKEAFWNRIENLKADFSGGNSQHYEKVNIIFKIKNENGKLPDNFEIIPMKHTKSLRLTNMYMMDENKIVRKFDTIYQVMNTYMKKRYEYYQLRKNYILNELREVCDKIENRARFIKAKVEGLEEAYDFNGNLVNNFILDTRGIKMDKLVNWMIKNKFKTIQEIEGKSGNVDSFDYILTYATTKRETIEEYKKLMEELQKSREEYKHIEMMTPNEMWINELDILEPKLREIDEELQKSREIAESSGSVENAKGDEGIKKKRGRKTVKK